MDTRQQPAISNIPIYGFFVFVRRKGDVKGGQPWLLGYCLQLNTQPPWLPGGGLFSRLPSEGVESLLCSHNVPSFFHDSVISYYRNVYFVTFILKVFDMVMVMGDTEKITHLYNYPSDSTDSMTHSHVPESLTAERTPTTTAQSFLLPTSPVQPSCAWKSSQLPWPWARQNCKTEQQRVIWDLLAPKGAFLPPSANVDLIILPIQGSSCKAALRKLDWLLCHSQREIYSVPSEGLGWLSHFFSVLPCSSVLLAHYTGDSIYFQELFPSDFIYQRELTPLLSLESRGWVGNATGRLLNSWSAWKMSYECQILRLGAVRRLEVGGFCWYCSSTSAWDGTTLLVGKRAIPTRLSIAPRVSASKPGRLVKEFPP